MEEKKLHYPLFYRRDLTAFWALFADNLANIVILAGICMGVFNMPAQIVFGRILPGLGVSLIVGLSSYVYLARRLAQKEQRDDVTALPYGISTPVMFVYLFGIIGPVYWGLKAAGNAEASIIAWQVGMAAAFIGGIIEMIGSIVGPWLKRVTPRAGMLGTLAGIAIVWIATVPMAKIFENPLVGFASLMIVLAGLVAGVKMPFRLPAGLIAIIVGVIVGFFTGSSKIDFSGIAFHFPIPVLGDLLAGLKLMFSYPAVLAAVLPIEVYNFIETMNNVESAEAAGDKYPVRTCQILDGVGTMIGTVFGSAFPTTVYIGHPAYKRLKGRCGYALGVGIILFLGAIFGFIHMLYNLIPEAAVAPMLVFVGLVITAQAFSASPAKHSIAVAVALIPHMSSILYTKIKSAVFIANANMDPGTAEFVQKCAEQGIVWIGQSALAQGAIITGLLWGAIMAMLIDLDFKKAATFSGTAAGLTLIGIVHSPSLGFHFSTIFWGYMMMTALFVAAWLTKIEKDPEIGELDFKGN
ncbi:MAG: xanthine/uracil/vitamin C permease [Desulfobacterales bacterium]|nr:xanthine/uracil/vitamin C permease [Desulfobacterales bacterium]